MEKFQWLSDKQSQELPKEKLEEVKDELADIFNYLIRIASKLNIDLISAANEKIKKNAEKYPVEKAKGNSKKYTEL